MASGRTISANLLTERDKEALVFCKDLSKTFSSLIEEPSASKSYLEVWGKVALTRDAGMGVGGGKLQRDALCTRGRSGKEPFSNRNLRWHPLIIAHEAPSYATPLGKLNITGKPASREFEFKINSNGGVSDKYSSSNSYEIDAVNVALPIHWEPFHEELKEWKDVDWNRNSCFISAAEYCSLETAVSAYVSLATSILVGIYSVKINQIKEVVSKALKANASLYEENLMDILSNEDLFFCPVCKNELKATLEGFRVQGRSKSWKPGWKPSKQNEGEDNSPQIMHVNPLVEREIRHTASNVRFGHRWCNIAMTDHSLSETLKFMGHVVEVHDLKGLNIEYKSK